MVLFALDCRWRIVAAGSLLRLFVGADGFSYVSLSIFSAHHTHIILFPFFFLVTFYFLFIFRLFFFLPFCSPCVVCCVLLLSREPEHGVVFSYVIWARSVKCHYEYRNIACTPNTQFALHIYLRAVNKWVEIHMLVWRCSPANRFSIFLPSLFVQYVNLLSHNIIVWHSFYVFLSPMHRTSPT